ncbi:MAG: helix-turn-helix domain-containing protein [Coriobacteriia bacterium]
MRSEEQVFLSVREVSERLGVSSRTVYQLLGAGVLGGAVRVGGVIRVPAASLNSLPEYRPLRAGERNA